eukprot:13471061-Alexandrium_andersonii.AAC.1
MSASLVGSEMCIRDRVLSAHFGPKGKGQAEGEGALPAEGPAGGPRFRPRGPCIADEASPFHFPFDDSGQNARTGIPCL